MGVCLYNNHISREPKNPQKLLPDKDIEHVICEDTLWEDYAFISYLGDCCLLQHD